MSENKDNAAPLPPVMTRAQEDAVSQKPWSQIDDRAKIERLCGVVKHLEDRLNLAHEAINVLLSHRHDMAGNLCQLVQGVSNPKPRAKPDPEKDWL